MSPGKLDRETVHRHLIAIDHAVQHLRGHRGTTVEHLSTDTDALWAVERGLQLCAQNALDVATYLVASAGRDAPDYRSAIDELAGMGVLPTEYVARFRGVAGFRYVLVHGYLSVDVALVHKFLSDQLEDFTVFVKQR